MKMNWPDRGRALLPALARFRLPGMGAPLAKAAGAAVARHIRRANTARDARNWAAARDGYAAALALDPSRGPIWVQYGHVLKGTGAIDRAVAAYRRAIALAPDAADPHLHLGHALKLQGRHHAAALSYARSAALDPALPHPGTELRALGHPPSGPGPGTAPEVPPHWLDGAGDGGLAALLDGAGLAPGFLSRFDPSFYATANRDLLGPAANPLRCLRHFCEVGLQAGLAISDTDAFDAAFHAAAYPDGFARLPTDAYRSWLNAGLPAGQAPNLATWLRDTQGVDLHDLVAAGLDEYAARHPDDAADPAALAAAFLDGGLLDGPGAPRPTPATAPGFVAAARRAAVRGRPDLAMTILQRLLAAVPGHRAAWGDYADRLLEDGRHFDAAAIYRLILADGAATRWTHLLLARCLSALDLPRDAFLVLSEGAAAFPEHPNLLEARAEALTAFFDRTAHDYMELARSGRLAEGQDLVAAYCRDAATLPADAGTERLPPRAVRAVALFANLDLPQCRLYRVDQKAEQLRRAGFGVTVFDAARDGAAFAAAAARFEAAIFYRVALLPAVIPAIEMATALGLLTFYEIDDLVFLPDEYPGALESFGGQVTAETHAQLAMGVPLFAGAMRLCDYAIASTPALSRAMAPLVRSGRAFVHRNALGAAHAGAMAAPSPPRQADQPVTLFYGSGTRAHKDAWTHLLEPALIELARRHGDRIAIVLLGWLPVSPALRAAARILSVSEPVFDLAEYWAVLRQADINLAVLRPSRDADCKSEIKWLEAAMFGIPSVVSGTETYAGAVRNGDTALLAGDTPADWVAALDRLVRDPALRERIGRRARTAALVQYGSDAMAGNLRAILDAAAPPAPSPALPRRRKILLVNVFYAPQLHGGATRVVHDNIRHLSAHHGDAFELEVFSTTDDPTEEYAVSSHVHEGVRVTTVGRSYRGELGPISDPRMGAIFAAHLEASRPDLVHFHCIQRITVAAVDAARERGIPYLVTAHDGWWISDEQFLLDAAGRHPTYDYARPFDTLARHGQRAQARMRALQPALAGAAAVLGVSEPFSRLYAACGVPRVRTVANGVSALHPLPRTAAPDGRVRLGQVGSMSRHKGFHLLKHAIMSRPYRNLSVTTVDFTRVPGEGREERWGTTPVHVVGKVAQDEVPALYAGIDVVMSPSLWPESFGLVTREALLCGCWVVASDRGAIGGDVTEGVNGHVIDVSSAEGMLAVLDRIDADPARYRATPPPPTLRTAAAQGEELAALYHEVLDGDARNGGPGSGPG